MTQQELQQLIRTGESFTVEHIGTGVRRIREAMAERDLAPPKLAIAEGWFSVTFERHVAATEQVGEHERLESGLESQTSVQVLNALVDQPLKRSEIARSLGHEKISGAVNRAVKELLSKELIKYTIPEKPNSRLQKYRLTEKGRHVTRERTEDDI